MHGNIEIMATDFLSACVPVGMCHHNLLMDVSERTELTD